MAMKDKLPEPFWHKGSLEFASCPCVSPEEYADLSQNDEDEDELITIRAQGRVFITGFVELRSTLARSPTLAAFFASKHYLPGTKMSLWFLNEDSVAVFLALRYLLLGDNFVIPESRDCPVPDRIVTLMRLYFLAKRMQLPGLEDITYAVLVRSEPHIEASDVVDFADIIYEKPTEKDDRIRSLLQRLVQKHLRALLNDCYFRALLRESRPNLSADLFELVSTILLDGEAGDYPLRMPLPVHQALPELGPEHRFSAIFLRKFEATQAGQLTGYRGDMLWNCDVDAGTVTGTDSLGRRGQVPRDYVEVVRCDVEDAYLSSEEHSSHHENDDDGDGDDADEDDEDDNNNDDSRNVPVTGKRDKASWVLGMDTITDVFDVNCTPSSSGSSEKTKNETPKEKGGWKAAFKRDKSR